MSRRRCRRCRRLSLVEKSIQLHETRTRECKREGEHRVRECKREKEQKKKKIFLFNPFCVRARAPATVCVLLNVCVCEKKLRCTTKTTKFLLRRGVWWHPPTCPHLPSLSRRDYIANAVVARPYNCVCACVCLLLYWCVVT